MIATIVEWGALGQTILAAVIAGVGVAFTFSLAIYGAARLSAREATGIRAAGFGLIAVAGLALTAAAIAFGIVVMVSD